MSDLRRNLQSRRSLPAQLAVWPYVLYHVSQWHGSSRTDHLSVRMPCGVALRIFGRFPRQMFCVARTVAGITCAFVMASISHACRPHGHIYHAYTRAHKYWLYMRADIAIARCDRIEFPPAPSPHMITGAQRYIYTCAWAIGSSFPAQSQRCCLLACANPTPVARARSTPRAHQPAAAPTTSTRKVTAAINSSSSRRGRAQWAAGRNGSGHRAPAWPARTTAAARGPGRGSGTPTPTAAPRERTAVTSCASPASRRARHPSRRPGRSRRRALVARSAFAKR
jgi:hypothetical protein